MAASDYYSNTPQVIDTNNRLLQTLLYQFRMHIIAAENNRKQYEGIINREAWFSAPYTDLEAIDFGTWSSKSDMRKEYKLIDKTFYFNPAIWQSNIELSKNELDKMDYATTRGLGKANLMFDKAILEGNIGNPGIKDASNSTTLASKKITNASELVDAISNLKLNIGEANHDDQNQVLLVPSSLKPMLEQFQLTSPASNIEDRMYKYLGTEGVDFNWIHQDVSKEQTIICSYAPNVQMLFVRTPEVLGAFTNKVGSVDETSTNEVGFGSVGIYSTNGNKAIMLQPYTIS